MGKKLQKISKYRPSLFQGSLHFVGGRQVISLSVEHPFESIVFRALVATLFLLLAGYLYFVSATVLNIMARKEADIESSRIQGSLAGLEQQYFALSQSVDEHVASSLGLSELKGADYVYVPGSTASAAGLARNEI